MRDRLVLFTALVLRSESHPLYLSLSRPSYPPDRQYHRQT